MLFSTLSSVAVAALVSVAQAVNVQVVSVGSSNGTLKFSPQKITAAVGSMVQFQFRGGNHTVTQSNFDNPCIPISSVNSSILGIYSGYQPVAASASQGQIPVFTVMINSTAPIWVFCSQGKHCQNGMSMVINENTNANSTRSLETYQSMAKQQTLFAQTPTVGGANGGTTGSTTETGSTTSTTAATGAAPGLAPPTFMLAVAAAFMLL